jgi:hypothetical protein
LVKTPVLTTIHGFSSPQIMPAYEKYRDGYFEDVRFSVEIRAGSPDHYLTIRRLGLSPWTA